MGIAVFFIINAMISKRKIYTALEIQLNSKIKAAQSTLEEATESVHAETKGSAGDKHETGRAMAQLEVEKAGKHLQETQQLKSILHILEPEVIKNNCNVGALVKSTQGLFYLSIGIGKIIAAGQEIFCIGMNSPLGQALMNKTTGEKYTVAGKDFEILEII